MKKSTPISVRVKQDLRDHLDAALRDGEAPSLTVLVERIIEGWVKERILTSPQR